MNQPKKSANPKVTIIASKGANQAINYLLEDRDELDGRLLSRAIRYAVETIPPLYVASFRHLIAGGLLFGWCWWRGLRPTRQQWFASIVLGALFFLIGHGTLHWGQQTLPSGVAAILIATEPIFVAIILAATRRTRITLTLLIGLLLGLVGGNLEFVEAGMGLSLFDFPLQRLMTPLELCKMRFDGHSRLHVGWGRSSACHKLRALSNRSGALSPSVMRAGRSVSPA